MILPLLIFPQTCLPELCDCVLAVFSVADVDTFKEAERILEDLWRSGDLEHKTVVLVGNKTDLVRARQVQIEGNYKAE